MRHLLALALAIAALAPPIVEAAELRVAVLEFTNASADKELDSLGKGLQSMVTTDLAQVATFKVVERARLHDIQGELKLGRSGLVDKSTAARVGKLLGATHLVAGTFTVAGNQMRIDGRVFSVADGGILLAEKIDGERDAFFELEKALVQKIIDAAGVKLTARERGIVNRFHTVDYEAFKSFSQGVALFDEQKYDEAIAALRAAQTRDAEFKLATVTLAEYQDIIARVRGRADELQTTEAQLQALSLHKGARADTEVIQKLYAIADRKSGGDAVDRLTALYMLASALGNVSSETRDVIALQKVEDRFALQRTADALMQSYWSEAAPLFPRLPPVVRDQLDARFPRPPETLEQAFKRTRDNLLAYSPTNCPPEKTRELRILCGLKWKGLRDDPMAQFPRRLHLDGAQTAEHHMRLYEMGVKIGAPAEWRQERLRELAEEHRRLGDLDRSTSLYQALAGSLGSSEEVRGIAPEIELNKAVAEALRDAPQKQLLRELLQLSGSADEVVRRAPDREPSRNLLQRMGSLRQFPRSDRGGASGHDLYVLVGDQPVWMLQSGQFTLSTGPRSDPFRAASVRYAAGAGEKIDSLLVVEGVPRRDVRLSFEIGYTPPPGFMTAQGEPHEATGTRPEVAVLFAARDVDCDERPMRALLLVLRQDAVELAELSETGRGENGHAGVLRDVKKLARAVKARQSLDLRGDKVAVTVEIAGDRARVRANGKEVSIPVAAERTGFYGLAFSGAGYAVVRTLKTR